MKRIWEKIQNEDNSNRIVGILKMKLPDAIFKETYSVDRMSKRGKKEVILSMELINNG